MPRSRWTKRILAVYFLLFLLFLYGPMIVMAALSFQGPQGAVTFPMRGLSFHWWNELVERRALRHDPRDGHPLARALAGGAASSSRSSPSASRWAIAGGSGSTALSST